MIAEDRRQMSQFLGERMTRSYSQLSKRQQLEADTSLVKTYLIEAHETEQPQSLVRQTFGARSKAELAPVRIHESNEQTLVTLETHSGNEAVFAYIDFTDPRFG